MIRFAVIGVDVAEKAQERYMYSVRTHSELSSDVFCSQRACLNLFGVNLEPWMREIMVSNNLR